MAQEKASEILRIFNGEVSFSALVEWNEQLEDLWKRRVEGVVQKNSLEQGQIVEDASNLLFSVFLSVYEGMTVADAVKNLLTECSEERILRLDDILCNENEGFDQEAASVLLRGKELSEVTRSAKNYLRWYLQIYQPTISILSEAKALENLISAWQSRQFLKLLPRLIATSKSIPYVCRNLCQLLFFATYSTIPGSNPVLDETYLWLVKDSGLISIFLSTVLNSTSNDLTVSVLRNVHNALVSFPGTTIYVMQTRVKVPTSQTELVASLQGEETVDFVTTLKQLALLCLQTAGPEGFSEDQTKEVLVEILRIMYALRLGTRLPADHTLVTVVDELLRLNSVGFEECQSSAITILMDADPSFAENAVANGHVNALLGILERQMSIAVEQNQVDSAGAASLTPILVVFYKYSQANEKFLKLTKQFVFPPQDEDIFAQLVQEHNDENGKKGKNMSPLNAPPGTVRYKLIRLLTWPNSHIKRFAGELLWILCDKDPQQFTYRVGFGNGLPILSLKGCASIPGTSTIAL